MATTGHNDDSALRECDESRGTRYSERHSAQKDAVTWSRDRPLMRDPRVTFVVAGVRRPRSDETHQAGLLVQAELVALDVLHHEARFVFLIGKEQTQAPSAERFQSSRFSLKRRHSLIASQPHPDSYVEV